MRTRKDWYVTLWKISEPVFRSAAAGTLKSSMPVVSYKADNRAQFSYLEAFGRTVSGIAPWLELQGLEGKELELQTKARSLVQTALASITNPESPDYLNFNQGAQPLVDAAYLAQALLRAPNILWAQLANPVKQQIFDALISTRRIKPYFNNWLLFSAIIEAFFCKIGMPFDGMRIDYAIRQMDQWYVGDGMYSDGPEYHNDYYNSYVIHPFLLDILTATRHTRGWNSFSTTILKRAQRYAEVLERMISPEGTMPVAGRSITYRCGNLHGLAHIALINQLPETLKPAQVRCAMSAAITRYLSHQDTFDSNGWLNIGLCGNQPSLSEDYISTGSLYAACWAFLPLGLPPTDAFWANPDELFSSQRLYAGLDASCDFAYAEKINLLSPLSSLNLN
jgi:hypothetical protein